MKFFNIILSLKANFHLYFQVIFARMEIKKKGREREKTETSIHLTSYANTIPFKIEFFFQIYKSF